MFADNNSPHRMDTKRQCTCGLIALPEDVTAKIFECMSLADLPRSLRGFRLTCVAANIMMSQAREMWHSLCAHIGVSPTPARSHVAARKSSRLLVNAATAFMREWIALLSRGEALHHMVATMGQDKKDLSVTKLKACIVRWGPWPLIDRVSPVYNSTLLMEVCRARGVYEKALVAAASHLIFSEGANPNARPPPDCSFTCTPLIIAACRGLPRLTAFLLVCGAEPACIGEGRFRLCGMSASIAGRFSTLEWTDRLLAAEEEAGVVAEHRRELEVCRSLVQHVLTQGNGAEHVLWQLARKGRPESTSCPHRSASQAAAATAALLSIGRKAAGAACI
jgi:hypothetical protein